MAATCLNFNGATCRWRGNPSVLNGGTISVFSHSTYTIYEKKKKKKTEGAKNKSFKPQGTKMYLTLYINIT
jgi:hypothetical protein